ncbi:MAG: 2,3-bisphosphoglycerate-independent phosphoglycerate mutase [Deltaproteobacteria bacterium]|nr:2,3-bisphosphoglycerate-independent phosphoglycerate mutase [Deltaproteobacteria bacterium]
MKIILVLLDGLGDRSCTVLNYRTPLEAADTPNLDRLAQLGGNGLFHPSSPGLCFPSETAHFLLFGYDLKNFPGRGLFEAVGEGVSFDNDDVLVLAHISGVIWENNRPVLTLGRDNIKGTFEDIGRLYSVISSYESKGVGIRLEQTRRNDAVLVLTGPVSPYVSDSDPIIPEKSVSKIVPLSDNPEPEKSKQTAEALNHYLTFCYHQLKNKVVRDLSPMLEPPAEYFLVTQRSGRRIDLPPFRQHWGLNGLMIASGSVYGGLAHELGIDFQRVLDSDDPGMDLNDRIRMALADTAHDFIHVHTKIPDEAAHTGDPLYKKDQISRLDRGLKELADVVEKEDDLLVVITADHSTPSISPMIHSGEPVPVIMAGPSVRRDDVRNFSEIHAAKGCLGMLRGEELMLMMLNFSNRGNLYGHQLGPVKRAYLPSDDEPFELT